MAREVYVEKTLRETSFSHLWWAKIAGVHRRGRVNPQTLPCRHEIYLRRVFAQQADRSLTSRTYLLVASLNFVPAGSSVVALAHVSICSARLGRRCRRQHLVLSCWTTDEAAPRTTP